MILAGTDTTTPTMTWALALLLNNCPVLQKAQHELDTHIGRKRQDKESDIKNLVYLEAIVKETLRLYAVIPLSIPHESMTDCTVGGYHVVAGTRLLLSFNRIQKFGLIRTGLIRLSLKDFLQVIKMLMSKVRVLNYYH